VDAHRHPARQWSPCTASTTPTPTRSGPALPRAPRYAKSSDQCGVVPEGGARSDEVARYALTWHRTVGIGSFSTTAARARPRDRPFYVVAGWEVALIVSIVHTVFYLVGNGPSTPSVTTGEGALTTTWPPTTMVGVAGGREGLHNNHHARRRRTLVAAKAKFDPAWWCPPAGALKMATSATTRSHRSRRGGSPWRLSTGVIRPGASR